jgi:hypothetical protein
MSKTEERMRKILAEEEKKLPKGKKTVGNKKTSRANSKAEPDEKTLRANMVHAMADKMVEDLGEMLENDHEKSYIYESEDHHFVIQLDALCTFRKKLAIRDIKKLKNDILTRRLKITEEKLTQSEKNEKYYFITSLIFGALLFLVSLFLVSLI